MQQSYGVELNYLSCLFKNRGNVRINVTLRRVPVTIIAVEKQNVLHILTVYL
jgi:L-lactate utilization protein LutB